MKKIYSFLLIATALFFSTNMRADNEVSWTLNGEPQAAQDFATVLASYQTNGLLDVLPNVVIDLTQTVGLTERIRLNNVNMTINMNGQNIEMSGEGRIDLYHGSLFLQGQGTVHTAGSQALNIYGSEDASVVSGWSHLYIGKDVTISADGAYCMGFMYAQATLNTILSQTDKTVSYGALVDIYGKLNGTNSCIATNGTQNKVIAVDENSNEMKIYVHDGAVLSAGTGAAIYSPAFASWYIGAATISGSTGIYVKGGVLNIEGATITATGEYEAPQANGNGFTASGSAIVLDNNAAYTQSTILNISGNTEVKAESGYALLETVTTGQEKYPEINISGGTFEGGNAEGVTTIHMTEEEAAATIANATITGGNWSDNSVLNYVNESNLLVAELTNDGETSFTLTKPAEGTTISAGENLSNVTASETTNVKLSGDDDETISSNMTVAYLEVTGAKKITIPAGMTLTAGTVVLGENAVIDVQAGGKLVVTGSTGIVAWKASNIVLHAAETTEGNESAIKAGQLLLAPAVTSNVHPFGTVEFLSKSYRVSDSERMTQFFGVPMYNANVTSVAYTSPSTYRSRFMVWNGTSYDLIGYLNPDAGETEVNSNLAGFNQPFGYYAIDTWKANDASNTSFSFTGSFNGNENVNITMNGDWVTLTNAFTGNLKTEAVLEALQAMKENGYDQIDNAVYMYEQSENGALQWNPKNAADVVESISPMAPLMFNSAAGYPSLTINYNNMIYAPATSAAPARKADRNWTKAKIMMEGQGMRDRVVLVETDEDLNAEKYLNGISNIYVSAEKKMGIYASEDVNNTLVGYSVRDAGIYTLTFTDIIGNDLVLVDLANGAQVNIEEGVTYTFAASANETNDTRFQIVEARKMPTDIETVESAKAQKGIYNMVGAYLGEDFDVLPAGIYVVNGVKVVK